jgi:predicted Fe-Mo cluster-binding NifX family protein
MRVAIPVFGARVSPRFDCAPSLLLFTVENGKVLERGEVLLTHWDVGQRLERLRELNIQALICGGIDGHSAQVLKAHQIQVTAWVAGEAEEAMKSFIRGDLKSGLFLYPGCRRKRVRMRKGKF